ncbi:ArsR/SmtB family transcription factor [Deinococcus cellulosilyticus]|uniref:Transcriptional regulator n=1 Tax=Deinococcus cellulosilyticus (strain DSM 18568 / NBRC 106333 / KACC 11606 / 5516J-15) TaxID=1223518 RepID=A0A511MWP5_DEIC1|nr:helix-turn-helix domain-containing protein [Deinococcus cellulosilyticus]GEM44546.1 transcriptional regulator [Deinococcus cellulosilyticus NBRC 106333 = KACC 11606]
MIIARNKTLVVEGEEALKVLSALNSDTRLLILSLLSHRAMNVSALTEALGLPHSTVNFNLKQLEDAGLLNIQYMPGTRGRQKMISKNYDEILLKLPGVAIEADQDVVEVSMPIGNYKKFEVKPTCGLASESKYIGLIDDPRSFYEPEHVYAQLIWFRTGFVEYDFPNNLPYGSVATEVEISMEICSEAPEYDLDWPSDITLWVNGTEVGTWTSPADFGGVKAKLTPAWWSLDQTTHGLLKRWRITSEGAYIDGEKISAVTTTDLKIEEANHVEVRIGVKPDARHPGGLNLFGRRFGNYEQDVIMRTRYAFREGERPYKIK